MAGGGNPQNQMSVYDRSANNLNQAAQGAKGAMRYQPMQVGAQSAASGMGAYQNPYQQQVIDNTMGDMDRARQMTMNDIGAQATSAGAFGGSRHGLVEAENNRNFYDRVGNMSAQMNQQGFNTALGASQFDVGNKLQAGMANQGAGLQANGQALQGAGQLGSLSNLGFGMGQDIQNQQWQQGTFQQGMMQQLIDAAKGQYQGFTNAPMQSLNAPLAAIGGVPYGQTQTSSQSPGLFNYLSLGASLL